MTIKQIDEIELRLFSADYRIIEDSDQQWRSEWPNLQQCYDLETLLEPYKVSKILD